MSESVTTVGSSVTPHAASPSGGGKEESAISRLDAATAELVQWVRSRIRVRGVRETVWTPDHDKIVSHFLFNPDCMRLVAYVSREGTPQLVLVTPYTPVSVTPRQFCWFVRQETVPVSLATVRERVQFGVCNGGGLESLLRVMGSVYLPAVLSRAAWPDGVRRELADRTERFLASLTEASHQARGQTVLYIPPEDLPEVPPEEEGLEAAAEAAAEAAEDRDLVGRLGALAVHWTRQIREGLSTQGGSGPGGGDADEGGPLEELRFWQSRAEDLSSIGDQLRQDGVRRITAVLRAANSQYLGPFEALATRIREGSATARSRLLFLNLIAPTCEKLEVATPEEIPTLLPELLHRLRFLGERCPQYRDASRMIALLRRVSNTVIRRCKLAIDVDAVFHSDVAAVMETVQQVQNCGRAWRNAYDECVESIEEAAAAALAAPEGGKEEEDADGGAGEGMEDAGTKVREPQLVSEGADGSETYVVPGVGLLWRFDATAIFARVEAFLQRCSDLTEICEGQRQFARKTVPGTGDPAPLPKFGGSRGPEIVSSLESVAQRWAETMEALEMQKDTILDVRAPHWHDTNTMLKSESSALEVMLSTAINNAFEGVTSIATCCELLEAFDSMAQRQAIVRAVHQKAQDVWRLFSRHLRDTKAFFDANADDPPLGPNEPPFAGKALWAAGLQQPLESDWALLSSLHFIPDSVEKADTERLYNEHMVSYERYTRRLYSEWMGTLSDVNADELQERLKRPLLRRASNEDEDEDEFDFDGELHSTGRGRRGDATPDTPYLESNFDKDILLLFAEVHGWQKFGGKYLVPFYAADLKNNQHDDLRVLNEHVMTVVRDYNSLLDSLASDERRLFASALKKLDRALGPGFSSRITWISEAGLRFLRTVRAKCAEVQAVVDDFHRSRSEISHLAHRISRMRLVEVRRGHVYEEKEFAHRQSDHREKCMEELTKIHERQIELLQSMYVYFHEDPLPIQKEWVRYVQSVDARMERAVQTSVRESLLELQRAVCGDPKAEGVQPPLFRTSLQLEGRAIQYSPTIVSLSKTVTAVMNQIPDVIAAMPRALDTLPKAISGYRASRRVLQGGEPEVHTSSSSSAAAAASGTAGDGAAGESKDAEEGDGEGGMDGKSAAASAEEDELLGAALSGAQGIESGLPSFHDVVSNDEEVLDLFTSISNGMSASGLDLDRHRDSFNKFQRLWMDRKESQFRRYRRNNRTEEFAVTIAEYKRLEDEVRTSEESAANIRFVRVDHSLLKQALIDHCEQWQAGLLGVLHENARTELQGLVYSMQDYSKALNEKPKDLEHLLRSTTMLKEVREKLPSLEAKFGPIEAMYALLDSHGRSLPDSERSMREGLRESFDTFVESLGEVEELLKRSKASMKRGLQDDLAEFASTVSALRSDARKGLPYNAPEDLDVEGAMEKLDEFARRCEEVREQERALGPGRKVFDIPADDLPELVETESEIESLRGIWSLRGEWDKSWARWKTDPFKMLDPEELEQQAVRYKQRVGKFREFRKWGVWTDLESRVKNFLSTMPLISSLGSSALRERHWVALKEQLHQDFDETSPDFTLDRVFELGLVHHSDFIGELAARAQKELKIKADLDEIEAAWEDVTVPMDRYKEEYWRIKAGDDLQKLNDRIEEDMGTVSMIKGSKFYSSFAEMVDSLEHAIAGVSEVMELQLQVQRAWLYLESIFMASADIALQLPEESKSFEIANREYVEATESMAADSNARRACLRDGYLDLLTRIDERLDRIQKSLNDYLEKKRQLFPRFYFLSNADLLEILGQSTNPRGVQKHMKACFEGIKSLDLVQNTGGAGVASGWVATAMNSPRGEVVPFESHLKLVGPVEDWMNDIEDMMKLSVRQKLGQTIVGFGKVRKTPLGMKKLRRLHAWIHDYPGQLLITTGMMNFTRSCEEALDRASAGETRAMRTLVKNQKIFLRLLAGIVQGEMESLDRKKIVALITMEIHSRDVMQQLHKGGCTSVNDFAWMSQLRFEWRSPAAGARGAEARYGHCVVRQTNSELKFGYEYQGNNGRLVVTPLTDRCVLTLTTALYLQRGGAPAGPAGTGKTETVKDLGKNLAKYVVVFNCSDQLDYISVGRMFSGLAQSGSWGCFDEFNRITIEVLSVVAQQVRAIMDAIRERQDKFEFMGQHVAIRWECGIFITMNPGYAGRTELPDNLKSLFRPVSMMVPDLALIAEVMLQAEGFEESGLLAEKTVTLYNLMVQQLSKQPHYDYGLRSLRGVLVCAGGLKRKDPSRSESIIVLQAVRDMNVPKFIKEDKDLFMLLLGDLFPGLDLPMSDEGELGLAIDEVLQQRGLQVHDAIHRKCIELRDSKETRHCNMLVGETSSGKSVTLTTLAEARSLLAKRDVPGYAKVRMRVLNPKSISMNELYGAFDLQTMEWSDGILSSVFREFAKDESEDEKWLVLDGPVDTLWIESMNTVMDDNRTLTLINGDRISMSSSMSLVFEVQDLAVASPATVSRAGMIYLDAADLGWEPFVESWLARTFEDSPSKADDIKLVHGLFTKYVPSLLEHRRRHCKELIQTDSFHAVSSLCKLLHACALGGASAGETAEASQCSRAAVGDAFPAYMEKWFVFACAWSIGGVLDEPSRRKFNDAFRDADASVLPAVGTAWDVFVDPEGREFKSWSERVESSWHPPASAPFSKLIVPTVDTERNEYVVGALIAARTHALVVGETGTGKTVVVQRLLEGLDREAFSKLTLNFSAATESSTVQEVIEGSLEKKAKDKMGPPGGRRLVAFVDDLNMPKKDTFGSQPPLELLRQWVDYGGWYDREKLMWKHIQDMQLVAAMGPPGGGRTKISPRLQSCFNVINFVFPADKDLAHIFEALLSPHLAGSPSEEVRTAGAPMVSALIGVYKKVVEVFLPTPTKSHYLFNMRDIARVIEGMRTFPSKDLRSRNEAVRLWAHEAIRVIADRFASSDDLDRFRGILSTEMIRALEMDYDTVMDGLENPDQGPVYCSFLVSGLEKPPYTEVNDLGHLKRIVDDQLQDYNDVPKHRSMDLVLFRDALRHIARIHRVLSMPRGHALLIGVGGSGRQSLARLAAWVTNEMEVFQIEISKQYGMADFHEDLKRIFEKTGVAGTPVTFLFSDTQIKEEGFIEDINSILSSGQVPNLYPKEEKLALLDSMRPIAKGIDGYDEDVADDLWACFISRVRANLHIVLAMSPVGDGFRDRTRMYPSLVSNTTMDWFHEWPTEALKEVAEYFLEDLSFHDLGTSSSSSSGEGGSGGEAGGGERKMMEEEEEDEDGEASALDDDGLKRAVATVFALAHRSVSEASKRMVEELRRYNYVTPTNYLELVQGYKQLLQEKRQEIGDLRDKLKNGLAKLDESREQVEVMKGELKIKQETVRVKREECDNFLVQIVADQREANEKEAEVSAEAERIAEEKAISEAIAREANAELDRALPALREAQELVQRLSKDKSLMSEVKGYAQPPELVRLVMEPVMILFKGSTKWESAKAKLADTNFVKDLVEFKKDNISDRQIRGLQKYINQEQFTPDRVGGVSKAAAILCSWVRAMYTYSIVSRDVEPKRERVAAAEKALAAKERSLAAARATLKEIKDKLAILQEQLATSTAEKERLEAEAEELSTKLDRAEKLVTGLSGEKERWQTSIGEYERRLGLLPGDSLVAAAFLSYAGPFDSGYRTDLTKRWVKWVKEERIPADAKFQFSTFLAKPTDVSQWNIQGLPSDDFSTENGVIVTRGSRWPLVIDPQQQANRWIKRKEKGELNVADLKDKDFLKKLTQCISFGMPYLLQDVEEELDPAMEPVLAKAIVVRGARKTIRVGDAELDWSDEFRLFISTKLSNPHYSPEICTKVALVNFSVKEEGLEAQLLGQVCEAEAEQLQRKKTALVEEVAEARRLLLELEDKILHGLATTKGSLLDDASMVETLQASKVTSEEVTVKIQAAVENERKIDIQREGYRPVARNAALLFFVLDDLGKVDPMYQFSLDAYKDLFGKSIIESRAQQARDEALSLVAASGDGEEGALRRRIQAVNDYHTYAVYTYACRGLFERHKLLLSLQICARRMRSEKKLPKHEWDYFLKGGVVVDRSEQRPNPCPEWLSAVAWDNITEVDKGIEALSGLASSFETNAYGWKDWYEKDEPEKELLAEWETKVTDLQRLIIVRCVRPDRVLLASQEFVRSNLGARFTEPPGFDLKGIWESSNEKTPLVYILSPGVDPTKELVSFAESQSIRIDFCSLGQGQAPIATRMLREGLRNGTFVFLQNCHLSISWMPTLEKIVSSYCTGEGEWGDVEVHPDFRLWLSSAPHPRFPISILQRGIKMTTEPPSGLKANLMRLYTQVDPSEFGRRSEAAPDNSYHRLFFALCWFHSILLERRKFKALGWNIPYGFTSSDHEISADLLATYLTQFPDETPWDALRYLIAESSYGGRVTQDQDRRVLTVYIDSFFNDAALAAGTYPLADGTDVYFIPDVEELPAYIAYIKSLPTSDHPFAFGQHPNADIQSALEDTRELLATVLSLQPRTVDVGSETDEDKVLRTAKDMERQVPSPVDVEKARESVRGRSDPGPLVIVLFQEIDRYNSLVRAMRASLKSLQRGIQGLVVITPELEAVFAALLTGRVPEAWGFCYPSLKPLGPWMRDLRDRMGQIKSWADVGPPPVCWLGGITYPTSYFTALLQTKSRAAGVAINELTFSYIILEEAAEDITTGPDDGAYIRGLFLEGAGWNIDGAHLDEPEPMQLTCAMPVIHFHPREMRKGGRKDRDSLYECPLYLYPIRTGTRERPSFMSYVDLNSGAKPSSFWIKRGTALLLSLAT